MQSIRDSLKSIKRPQPDAHPGLWLDKYLPEQQEKGVSSDKHYQNLVLQLADQIEPQFFKTIYASWLTRMQATGATLRKAVADGRMVIGIGSESVIETGIALHRTYGVPYLPGSALKGLAANYTRNHLGDRWSKDSEAYTVLFGRLEQSGCVNFHDALFIPGSGKFGKLLHLDIMAVHHPEYYQGKLSAPSDWDQPTLINFLTAAGSYHIPLSGPEQWVDAAFEILALALRELGIGAKTAAGYGRMTLEPKPVDQDKLLAQDFLARLDALSYQNVAGQIDRFYREWKALSISSKWRAILAQAMIDKNAGRLKKVRDKDWYKELVQCVEQSALDPT